MKNITPILLLALTLTACGGETATTDPVPAEQAAEEEVHEVNLTAEESEVEIEDETTDKDSGHIAVTYDSGSNDDNADNDSADNAATSESSASDSSSNEPITAVISPQTLDSFAGADVNKTTITINEDGSFSGTYMGTPSIDGYEAGDAVAVKRDASGWEVHESEFTGRFVIEDQIDEYSYKVSIKDFQITSPTGELTQLGIYVDFAHDMDPADEYILYLAGTPDTYFTADDSLLSTLYKPLGSDATTAQSDIIYNVTKDSVFKGFDSGF